MSKIPVNYIVSELKKGGYIAEYRNYSDGIGGKLITGTTLQGVSLMDNDGKVLADLSYTLLNELKGALELNAIEWSHGPTRSSGIEYYLVNEADELAPPMVGSLV